MRSISIALVGDYSAQVPAHRAIPRALELAGHSLGVVVEPRWIGTETLEIECEQPLQRCAAVWCVPASPYRSMAGALNAIRFARERRRPFLGTCGGFQHALIEYARNVLGLAKADHEESNPAADLKLITRLSCSLAERRAPIQPVPGSLLARIYGTGEVEEGFNCNFGFNAAHAGLFSNSNLQVCARDLEGEMRAVELRDHPFFVATLFQPERSALSGIVHPLIAAYVKAAQT